MIVANNNIDVIKLWKLGKNARNRNRTLTSLGPSLYSCNLKIGHRHSNGATIVADYTARSGHPRSPTTSGHVLLACKHADDCFHPLLWETTEMHEEEVPF